jgi:small subunit ribosomal protein S17
MAKAKTTTESETTKDKSAGRALASDKAAGRSGEAPAAAAAEAGQAAAALDSAAAAVPMARESAAPAATAAAGRGRRQVKVGRVVSSKMNKTVIVTVENTTTHRLYHRYMKRTSKFAAHDAENRCQVGDVVEIVSNRPLSRTKRWRVREILKRAE